MQIDGNCGMPRMKIPSESLFLNTACCFSVGNQSVVASENLNVTQKSRDRPRVSLFRKKAQKDDCPMIERARDEGKATFLVGIKNPTRMARDTVNSETEIPRLKPSLIKRTQNATCTWRNDGSLKKRTVWLQYSANTRDTRQINFLRNNGTTVRIFKRRSRCLA